MVIIEWFLLLLYIPAVIYWKVFFIFIFLFLVPATLIIAYIFNKYTLYHFNENLYFNEDTINIGDIIYDYTSIEKIIINVGSVVGDAESLPPAMMFLPPRISKGTDNNIKIIYEGKKKKYTILCETNYDYMKLKETSSFLKEKGICVKLIVSSYWIR